MTNVLLVIADALRWDYASVELYGELFETETWARARTPATYTAVCLPTMLTGSNDHGNRNFIRRVIPNDSLFHTHDSVMFSRQFGDGHKDPVLGFGEEGQFDIRGYSGSIFDHYYEQSFLDYLEERFGQQTLDLDAESPDHKLVVYHSNITHHAYGMKDVSKHGYGIEREPYEHGVKHIKERMKEVIETIPDDWVVIFTSDHGEGLGERGIVEHSSNPEGLEDGWTTDAENVDEDIEWDSVEMSPWTSEVPFVVNRDIDDLIPYEIDLTDIRPIVEYFLDDLDEIPQGDYNIESDIKFLGETGDENVDADVEERLKDLGYM